MKQAFLGDYSLLNRGKFVLEEEHYVLSVVRVLFSIMLS